MIDKSKVDRLRAVAMHRETYSPDANQHQVLADWARHRDALKEAVKMLDAAATEWTPEQISAWAFETFGMPAPAIAAARANQEMAEMMIELAKGDFDKADVEAADVIIVLCHYAKSRGIDLWAVVNEKMAVNKARQWKVAGGVGYHVKAPTP